MEKYSQQTKLAAVEAYVAGNGGLRLIAEQHGVDVSSLRKWIAAFQANGMAGIRLKQRERYAAEFKLQVLQRVREEHLSYRQAAALFDIRNFNIIGVWERTYDREGAAGLAPYHRKMTSEPPPSSTADPGSYETRSRQELLEELKLLRAEIAYLKKLDALVQAQLKSAQDKERNS